MAGRAMKSKIMMLSWYGVVRGGSDLKPFRSLGRQVRFRLLLSRARTKGNIVNRSVRPVISIAASLRIGVNRRIGPMMRVKKNGQRKPGLSVKRFGIFSANDEVPGLLSSIRERIRYRHRSF